MAKNGKDSSKRSEHGPRRKINGTVYLLTEEQEVNNKRNGEWWERKNGQKQQRLE